MPPAIDAVTARLALAVLLDGTSHGEAPAPEHVYLPPSHAKAMDPDIMIVTGMRGAGKTFWWNALQEPQVRRLLGWQVRASRLSEDTEVRVGFGVRSEPDRYPGKEELQNLMKAGVEPRIAAPLAPPVLVQSCRHRSARANSPNAAPQPR